MEFHCKEELSLLSHLLTYSTMDLCQYGLMDISFILWVVIQYYQYFLAQILSVLALRVPSCWLLCPFDITHHFLSTSLLFGAKCFIFPAPALESTISPRSPGSFYWRMVSRNHILGANCAHCYSGSLITTSRPFPSMQVESTWRFTNTHIQLYFYVCPSVSILKTMNSC